MTQPYPFTHTADTGHAKASAAKRLCSNGLRGSAVSFPPSRLLDNWRGLPPVRIAGQRAHELTPNRTRGQLRVCRSTASVTPKKKGCLPASGMPVWAAAHEGTTSVIVGVLHIIGRSIRNSTSYFPRNGNRRWTTSFTAASPEDFLSISMDHLWLESSLNLTRVWSTSRAAELRKQMEANKDPYEMALEAYRGTTKQEARSVVQGVN